MRRLWVHGIALGISIVMSDPRHGESQAIFVATFRREVEEVVGAKQDVEPARISGISVEDVPASVLIEDACAGPLLARELDHIVVVGHLTFGHFIFRERHVVVAVKVVREGRHPLEAPSHAFFERFDLVLGRARNHDQRGVAIREVNQAAVEMIGRNEQLGQPSAHPGPNMKWYTISWLLRSKRSASVSLPFGPSKTYCFSTLSQGSSRRCRLNSSRCLLNSFSFWSSSFRLAIHSFGETTSCS